MRCGENEGKEGESWKTSKRLGVLNLCFMGPIVKG